MHIFQCSVTCGKGWRKRSVQCVGEKFRCDYRNRPDLYTMCDMGLCPVWRAGRWSEVTRVNSLFCRSALEPSGLSGRCLYPVTAAWSDEEYCLSIANLFSDARNLFCIPTQLKWQCHSFPQCSVSCGNGKIERTVECTGGSDKCDSRTKPQATRSCNPGACPEWTVGDWSQVYLFTAVNVRYNIVYNRWSLELFCGGIPHPLWY